MKTKWGGCFRLNRIAVVTFCLVMLCGEALQLDAVVVRVNANQTTKVPDGGFWATAFPVVRQAINAAGDGDAVWVAAGTFQGSLPLKAGVMLYSGFSAVESDLNQRNWKTNFTTRSRCHRRPAAFHVTRLAQTQSRSL